MASRVHKLMNYSTGKWARKLLDNTRIFFFFFSRHKFILFAVFLRCDWQSDPHGLTSQRKMSRSDGERCGKVSRKSRLSIAERAKLETFSRLDLHVRIFRIFLFLFFVFARRALKIFIYRCFFLFIFITIFFVGIWTSRR